MQKLCCVRTRQHPLPVWSHKFVLSSTTHISTNSHPFLVGIVSPFSIFSHQKWIPNGKMASSFSWTSLFKSPKSSSLCFGEPTLGKLNPVKLLCSPTSSTLCDPTLAKPNEATEFCITKHILLCHSAVHNGAPFSVPRSPSETNRVSN